MLKNQYKHKYGKDRNINNKNIVKNSIDKIVPYLATLKAKQPSTSNTEKTSLNEKDRVSPRERLVQKENRVVNHYSPKYLFNSDYQLNLDGVDELSQIKFISKECSSIKQNQNDVDCASVALSGNHLEDYSPLFDKFDRNRSEKDDFILQIYDISEPDQSFETSFAKQCKYAIDTDPAMFQYDSDKKIQEATNRKGTIKKNRTITQKSIKEQKQSNFNSQIQYIFESLDSKQIKVLTHSNCAHQTLSTEVNYLIGSILTKIKFQNKQYCYQDFGQQFKQLMADSSQSQLKQIFTSNRIKREKKKNSDTPKSQKEDNCKQKQKLSVKQISFQISPTFQNQSKETVVNQKLSKIGQKLTVYLLKNNLIETQSTPKPCSEHKKTNFPEFRKISQNHLHQDLQIVQSAISSNSKTFTSIANESVKVQFSLRSESQIIRGSEGTEFELIFSQLNKHL